MTTHFRFFSISIILFFFFCGAALAQRIDLPINIKGDKLEHFPEENKIIASGGVVIEYKDVKLSAEKMVFDTKEKKVQATGGVILEQDNNFFRCEKAEYNLEEKKGELEDASFNIGPWFGRATKIAKVADKEFQIIDGYITTCELEKTHYKIKSDRIQIILDKKVVAKNAFLYVEGLPVLFIPYYVHFLKDDLPSVSIIPGVSNDWGWYTLSAWKYFFNESQQGFLHLDFRQDKGFASGISHRYKSGKLGQGLLRLYYMDERDKTRARDIRSETERYRAQLRHIKNIDEENQIVLEYHKLSDKDFTKDYFYLEEFQEDSQPKSLASFTSLKPNYSVNFLAQKRINRFQEQSEYLPGLTLDVKSNKIKDTPFFYRGRHSLANLTKKYSSPSVLDDDANRLDSFNRISSPIKFLESGCLNPYLSQQTTFYSKYENENENKIRSAFGSGLDLSMKFYRQFQIDKKFLGLGLDEIRHIMTPAVNYSYIHAPTISSSQLSQFDTTDNLQRESKLRFSIENKLQAKRQNLEREEKRDLFDFILSTDYLFKDEAGSRFTNILADLEISPFKWMRIESDASFNTQSRDFQTFNFDLIIDKKDSWQLGIGHRYWQDQSSELTFDSVLRLSPKWKFGIYERYEFQTNKLKQHQYFIGRDLHCWQAEMGVDLRENGDENIWIKFSLTEFPDLLFKFNTRLSRPKYYYEEEEK